MYESFGFSRSAQNEQSLTLFVPDNSVDQAQYDRGGSCRIRQVRIVSDFQPMADPQAAKWDAATGLAMTKEAHPNGWVWRYRFARPLPDGIYQYKYLVEFENDTVRVVGDPCTKYGGDADDRSAFVIGGQTTVAEPIKNRIPPGDLHIYELMLDDFTAGYRGTRAPVDAVVDKIEHLLAMRINAVEFMPWIAWPDDTDFSWGYDPAYFFSVESKYVFDPSGPMDRLSRIGQLVTACHRSGVHVLLDIVLQHARQGSGTNGFPYYWLWQDVAECPFVGRFTSAPTYGSLPLDYGNHCTQEFAGDVCKYWLTKFNLDGFRFDQVSGYDNPDFPAKGAPGLIEDLRSWVVRRGLDNIALILEDTWDFSAVDDSNNIKPTSTWFDPFRSLPFGIFTGYASIMHVDTRYIRVLNAAKDFMWPIGPVTYIENHDHGSVTCRVGSRDRWYKTQPYMIALATCPGAVMLHNGQEWGQFEDIWEDDSQAPYADRRVQPRPLRWNEATDGTGVTLRGLYSLLFEIRREHPGLRSPNFYPDSYDLRWTALSPDGYGIDESRQIAIYHRWGNAADGSLERFIVALNFTDSTQIADIPFSTNGDWIDLINNKRKYTITNWRLPNFPIPSNWGCVFWQPA